MCKLHRASLIILSLCCLIFILASMALSAEPAQNIILFIGDGMGPSQVTIAQYYSELVLGEELNMLRLCNEGSLGMMTTHAADVLVTDSAAAGTALATGVKTRNKVLGQSISGHTVANVTEKAQKLGKKVGLVTNTFICDATPASFSANHYYRKKYTDIIQEQLLETQAEVYFGGGLAYVVPASTEGSKRADKRNLLKEAQEAGYTVVQNAAELAEIDSAKTTKLLGLFAKEYMAYEIDRETTEEPSLAEMTRKAIEILSQGEQGFFLMVEGGKIDKACHNSDAAATVREVLMFDEAVGIGMEYANSHQNTLVIWTADHETGGMFMGYYKDPDETEHNVTRETLERLGNVDASFDIISKEFGRKKSIVRVQNVIKQHYGFTVADEEAWLILRQQPFDVFRNQKTNILGQVISLHLGIAFATGEHTATPVMIGGIGPYSQLLRGYHDNTYIATVMIQAFTGENVRVR